MTIPEKCTVLVVGGGPGGSYAASVLARENISVVLLEADQFPRYHIGESMLPTFRHYLKFIDLHKQFDAHGFTRKNGAVFKLSPHHREGWTDFLAAGGEDNYAWNIVRSEADNLIYRYAGECGAHIFDGVKVISVAFDQSNGYQTGDASMVSPGRPVSAVWSRKSDGTTGEVKFDYIVDATGRAGLLSTKYLKNRQYNTTLKNVASWAYFSGGGSYGQGTKRANSPFFEALRDESGWAWFIPLHNGRHSVGVVMDRDVASEKKKSSDSTESFFQEALKNAPMVMELLGTGKRETEIKSASDYSYNAPAYAFPYARIVGDAGCFIDPFFSSGVHLAITGALSAATTICASIRGDCDEKVAAKWHSNKVRESYARFLLVILSAYKQMRHQKLDVLNELQEDNFDRAFSFFQPVIQGSADSAGKVTQVELEKTFKFLTMAFSSGDSNGDSKEESNGTQELGAGGDEMNGAANKTHGSKLDKELSEADREAMSCLLKGVSADQTNIDNFTTDVVDGRVPRLEKGNLTLVLAAA